MTDFFADSYAILAALGGDSRYGARLRSSPFRTSVLNLMEAHQALLIQGVSDEEAAAKLSPIEPLAEPVDWALLREASNLRRSFRKQGRAFSYVDAAGYAIARRLGLPFLTGDRAFEGLPGVEFLRQEPDRRHARRTRR